MVLAALGLSGQPGTPGGLTPQASRTKVHFALKRPDTDSPSPSNAEVPARSSNLLHMEIVTTTEFLRILGEFEKSEALAENDRLPLRHQGPCRGILAWPIYLLNEGQSHRPGQWHARP